MLNSKDIAYYLIALNHAEVALGYDDYVVAETQLQQLMYYGQGLSLHYFNRVLFKDPFYLYKTGPTLKAIARNFNGFNVKDFSEDMTDTQRRDLISGHLQVKAHKNIKVCLDNAYTKRSKLKPLYTAWLKNQEQHGKIISNQQIKEAFDNYLTNNENVMDPATDAANHLFL